MASCDFCAYNEYDEDDEDDIIPLSSNEYLIEGSMNLEDLSDALHISFESEDYDSIGGYLIGLLDHIPKLRESVLLQMASFYRFP